jgi:hypothetical protein
VERSVNLFAAPAALVTSAAEQADETPSSTAWFRRCQLRDGSDYLEWAGLFEFVISADGCQIAARFSPAATIESFYTYLLGQVLSYALIKQGLEPLHATVVVVKERALALIGDSGYGKSSLAAAFLRAGAQLLTDDLLVIKEIDGRWVAYPGPPRIKLFPETARAYLGEQAVGVLMNNATEKLVIPVDVEHSARSPQPIKTFFRLRPPSKMSIINRVTIRTRSQRQACFDLIANTYNSRIRTRERLSNQFGMVTRLANTVPVKALSYPRELSRLPEVVDAIVKDSVNDLK